MTEASSHGGPAAASAGNLILASNRLPVSLSVDEQGGWQARKSSGGLAAALAGLGDERFVWVGWPGCVVPAEIRRDVADWMARSDLVPVFLSAEEEELYYHGISNHSLWPLLHYFTDKLEFTEEAWQVYCEVNRRFAETILSIAEPGSRVWIQDFHLTLVPGFLREARPDLEIGFFLHIPFPSSEIYRQLPAREEVLRGLLGADYIGFHIHDYARHFRSSCLRVLGLESEHDAVSYEGRRVGVGVHPIGVDVAGFEERLAEPKTADILQDLLQRYGNRRLILGVERLDYTKGVRLKLQAFERLLAQNPELRGEVVLLQIIVPSRLDNPEYASLKRELEEYIGRLNGLYGKPGYTPVEYLHRSIDPHQLVALYRLANVCMVTPIRDGMNLVAQEFVLCQQAHDSLGGEYRGILLLSEFAGAAQVLPRALLANPWNIEHTVETLRHALEMPAAERRDRMDSMVRQVRGMECGHWARLFLARQADAARQSREAHRQSRVLRGAVEAEVLERFRETRPRVLLLDYDGTLRELVRTPEEAAPTDEIRTLLTDLAKQPDTQVHIVSGRHRADLDAWFSDLPIHLSAEHGFAWKEPGQDWSEIHGRDLDWIDVVATMLSKITDEVPGTRIERKPAALAWHYRMADLDYGVWRARELHSQLEHDLAHLPVDILHGHRVIEVRSAGVSKGGYVGRVLDEMPKHSFVLCCGDDRTDRDMYAELPVDAVSIHVGERLDDTAFTIESPARMRGFLRRLADV